MSKILEVKSINIAQSKAHSNKDFYEIRGCKCPFLLQWKIRKKSIFRVIRKYAERMADSMNDATRTYINQVADVIRYAFDVTVPIENIEKLVRTLGGTVVVKTGLDQLYDGTIRKVDENSFEIAISPSQGDERKNFTIAHELGHLFLHMGYLISKETWDKQSVNQQFTRFGANEQEYQANEFAAALLMPQKEFKQKLEEFSGGDYVDMSEVARYFHVSISAAINHGRFLGYLQ